MSESTPKLSICIPAYNAAAYLPAAIDSALGQTRDDLEVVVSDDCSVDDTPSVCEGYADPRFRSIRSEERLGQSGNWNRCLELARGEYVILLHADDELLAGYIGRAAAILDTQPEAGLVHCAVRHIDAAGAPLTVQQLFDEDLVDRDGRILRRLLLEGCVINPAGVLVRRAVYEKVGAFTDQIVWGVDWHMWIRIALAFPVAYLAEPLALYRHHGGSGTAAVMASGRQAHDEMWAIEDVFSQIGTARPDLLGLRTAAIHGVAHRTWCHAESVCKLGDMAAARTGIRNAVKIWPGIVRQPRVWALWAATYLGYDWFRKTHARTRRLLGRTTDGHQPEAPSA